MKNSSTQHSELTITYEEYLIKFRKLLASLKLNNSIQREYVLKLFFQCKDHLTADEVMAKLRQEFNLNIGIATVYRILSFLEHMNIIKALSLENESSKKYEINLKTHHDHLVCNDCGKVIEFYDSELERIQELIAQEKGFVLTNHHMILYGICKECQNK
ncbi:MAG: transcriptional repressor [Arcobacteraceae bacterium]